MKSKISSEEIISRYRAGERETLLEDAGVKNVGSLGRKMREVYGVKVSGYLKP